MGLVLKFEKKKIRTFLDISETVHFFFVQKTESAFFVFCLYLCEKRFILKNFITKMISEKFSTNPESFNKFGRGRRIDLADSGGMTQLQLIEIYVHKNFQLNWSNRSSDIAPSRPLLV